MAQGKMSTLDFYIVRHLLYSCLLVAVVLLSIFGVFELIEQLDEVGRYQYTYADAFIYTGYSLPRHLISLMPFIALIGTAISFSLLAFNNELVAVIAAGVSPRRIIGMSLLAGAVLISTSVVLEQFVSPYLDNRAFDMRASALHQYEELGDGLGLWSRSPDQILRVGGLQHGREPVDVELFLLNHDGELSDYISAERARIESSGQWVFEDVVHKHLEHQAISTSRYDRYEWKPFLGMSELGGLLRPAESLSVTDLYYYIRHLRDTGRPVEQYSLVFWEKFGRIIMTIAMILIVVHMVFKAPQQPLGAAAILVVLGALVFALLDRIIGNTGLLLGFPPIMAALTPEVALLAAGLMLYWKQFNQVGIQK
jgi:lipopolysaccharide export system permease protein